MQHQLPTIQQANNLPIGVPQLGGNKNIPRDPRPRRYGAVRFNLRHLWHQRCFRGRELHHLSGVSGRSGATNGWREVTVTKLHIHHGWWTANPTSPRFSWINIAIWCDMNIAKCFIEKCLRHPMTLHGGFHACAVSSQDFSKLMTDLPGWPCSRFGVEYSASQRLRIDLQKRKWKPSTSPKEKAFIGNDILL